MSHYWQGLKFIIFDLQGREALQVPEKKQDLYHLSL